MFHGSHIALNSQRPPAWLCGLLDGVVSMDAQLALAPTVPRVGVWDQLLKYGRFEKKALDGTPSVTVFNDQTCNEILDGFRDQENDLSMDKFHEIVKGKGHALAWHNALALVRGGRVIRMETHDPAVRIPVWEELLRRYSRPPGDGVYGHRSEVTTLGMSPEEGLATLRFVSPYFTTAPKYRLINTTATNDPFLDGVALAMEREVSDPLVMICLVPPADVSERLVVDGGESVKELHCTLLVLGPASAMSPARMMAVQGALAVLAANTSPIKARVGGAGRFSNLPLEAFHALVDSPELTWVREQLVRRLSDAGVYQSVQDHGFVPHITLKYVKPAEPTPCRIDAQELKFSGITVAVGDQWTTYEFLGAQAFSRSQEKPMNELYTRAGCMESDTPEEKEKKLTAYVKKMEEESEQAMSRAKAMEDDGKKKDSELAAMRKKMEGEGTSKDGKEKEKEEEAKKEEAMQRVICARLGLPADPEAAAAKIKSWGTLEERVVVMQREVQTIKADKDAAVGNAKLESGRAWARNAIAMGRYDAAQQGTEEATVEYLAAKHVADSADAEKMLHREGAFQPSVAILMDRLTTAGAPKGAPARVLAGSADEMWASEVTKRQTVIMEKDPKLAAHVAWERAEVEAQKACPAVYHAYQQLALNGGA